MAPRQQACEVQPGAAIGHGAALVGGELGHPGLDGDTVADRLAVDPIGCVEADGPDRAAMNGSARDGREDGRTHRRFEASHHASGLRGPAAVQQLAQVAKQRQQQYPGRQTPGRHRSGRRAADAWVRGGTAGEIDAAGHRRQTREIEPPQRIYLHLHKEGQCSLTKLYHLFLFATLFR